MLVRDFDYHLPDDRIAQEPAPRGGSRLLVLDAEGAGRHRRVSDLPELLSPGDLLVVNDTRVIPARLYGRRIGEGGGGEGGRVEVLLVERVAGSPDGAPEWEALTRPGRKTRPATRLRFEGGDPPEPEGRSGGPPAASSGGPRAGLTAEVLAKLGDGRHRLRFSEPVEPWLERLGHVPLPPYIKRPDRPEDRARYQTVFAERPGAIAAPTAGLHFTPELLARLHERGVPVARVTLHVGIGTFKPVTAELVHEHAMDEERYEVPEATAAAVAETRRRGGRVVAVGTTVVRTLESAARDDGTVAPGAGRTGLFIYPGFRFRAVDTLLTNFHLPRSTLLMLVAAFAGRDRVLAAYREAIAEGYRFYSYGDAMLAERAGSTSWKSGRDSRLTRTMPTADDTASRTATPDTEPRDFLRAIVAEDLATGKHASAATRFPPEPNGYLHIGHAKSIVLNFGIARENGGTCNLRFDDTNPLTEEMEYAEAIQEDVRWLGYEWDGLYFASDYFDPLYDRAERLIEKGLAYVDDLSEEEIRELRGTVTEPGRESPFRSRSPEENLDLFRRMRAGEFPDGSRVLRAKIDMASPNMKMRDPLLYRIRHADHYRTGSRWCIYPFYDFTHCLSDSFERITHSFCTLEFENNREIYDWILDALPEPDPHPRQIEFARLNLSYTVLSKRRLLTLVQEGHVAGWDDPRMPTLSGLRRRGVTPAAIRDFCDRIGVARADNVVDVALLEHSIRDDLNTVAPRVLCVLRPLKLIVENYPEDGSEELDAPYFPHDVGKPGSRRVPFSRELWIERDDFAVEPPPGFHRLAPGREVRLRYGYFVRCTGVEKDPATGRVTAVRCTYDPETRGGAAPDGRKVKGTIHWVSAAHARDVEVRLYDRLFDAPRPAAGPEDFREHLNPDSLVVLPDAKLEPAAAAAEPGTRFQFERQGYFYLDPKAAAEGGRPVFNRIVTLRDTWARIAERTEDAEKGERGVVELETPAQRSARSEARPAERAPRSPREGLEGEALDRFDRYAAELGLAPEAARALAEDPARAGLFEEALAAGRRVEAQALANWIVNELPRCAAERPLPELPVSGRALAELVALAEDGTLSSSAAREVLEELAARGGEPREIVRRRGLEQVSDEAALAQVVERVLAEHPDEAARFRAGEGRLQGFFVGQAMRATGGKANPELVNRLLRERSSGS